MVLGAQWPLGTIAQFFHFVAEDWWLGYHRYPNKYGNEQLLKVWKNLYEKVWSNAT